MRLIDADKMLKRIESWNTSDAMDKALYNFTLNRIIEQPTVEAEPVRHGKWLCSDDMYETAVCSVCNYDTEEPYEYVKKSWNFCLNCGAKMDEERKEE